VEVELTESALMFFVPQVNSPATAENRASSQFLGGDPVRG
jgi:hypothetical protein